MKVFIYLFIFKTLSVFGIVEKNIHIEGEMKNSESWSRFSSSEEINLKKMFEILQRSKTGADLLAKAQSKASETGLTLLDVIKPGTSSLTDTTLVRKFNPHSPEYVVYETRSIVYINKYLRWDDALLDLAHELTHYIYRENFNPYGEKFNPSDFVKGTIEGQGGEVQAFLTECKVLGELFSSQYQSRSQCNRIKGEDGKLSFKKAVSLFYNLGDFHSNFRKSVAKRGLQDLEDRINPDKINFVSSAYGVPYPIAALMEYDLVINKVCENDKKRLAYMRQDQTRSPASENDQYSKISKIYQNRCASFN